MAASTSKFTRMLLDATGATFGTSSTALVALNESLRKTITRMEDEGARGTRSRNVSRIVEGLTPVAGSIVTEPTPIELNSWLEFITGGTKSGNLIALAEALTAKAFACDRVARWYQYDGCVAASAQFESSAGQRLRLTTNVIGKTETDQTGGGAMPTPTAGYDVATANYMHHNLVMTLGGSVSSGTHSGGTAYTPERVGISIDNGVEPVFRNSQTATDLTARDRRIGVSIALPFTSTEYALNVSTAFAAKFVYTLGNCSLTFVFPALKAEPITPIVPGGTGEILLELNCNAYKSGTETEVYISNDSAP